MIYLTEINLLHIKLIMNYGNSNRGYDNERAEGYNYGNRNNYYTPLNPNDSNQQPNSQSNPNPYQYSNNPYLNNVQNHISNYNTTANENKYQDYNDHQYPQTGLNLSDAERGETRTEFILPENIKLAMILVSICCITCFFILLIVK